MADNSSDSIFKEHRDRYIKILEPLFLGDGVVENDVVLYFASLLRVLGVEDGGWDPYSESRSTLNDINRLMQIPLPEAKFAEPELTRWRLGLLLYAHIVEMDAPYEVITNLLRFRTGRGYSPSPYFDLLSDKEKKSFSKRGISTGRKIELISQLSAEAGLQVGSAYAEFYNSKLRNAIQHSDFILTDDDLRSRSGTSGARAFRIGYVELNELLTRAKAFTAAFFQIDSTTRQVWGLDKGKALPYDVQYKGLLEILVDENDLLNGFVVHWPNNSQSMYRRTSEGVQMVNCSVDLKNATISMFVGQYARYPGGFSPLVERDESPAYTPLDGSDELPTWPDE